MRVPKKSSGVLREGAEVTRKYETIHRQEHWAAGRVLDSSESGVSGCLSCCSVLLVDLALRPVPQGGVESFLRVYRARPGRQYPGWPCFLWDTPSDRPSRSLRVAPAGFRPGTRPAHPGPAHRRASAVALQVPGELLRGVLAAPVRVESSGIPSLLSCAGTCGPPYRSPRTTEPVPRVVGPVAYPTTFLVQQPGDGRQVHEPLPGCGYRWMSPTHLLSRLAGGGSPRPNRVGARAPGPAAPGRWRRVLSAWPRPGGPCSRMMERTVSGLVSTPLRARAA